MCFVWIPEHTAIISRYNMNWLNFIMWTVCLLAVRGESLHMIQFNFRFCKAVTMLRRWLQVYHLEGTD